MTSSTPEDDGRCSSTSQEKHDGAGGKSTGKDGEMNVDGSMVRRGEGGIGGSRLRGLSR